MEGDRARDLDDARTAASAEHSRSAPCHMVGVAANTAAVPSDQKSVSSSGSRSHDSEESTGPGIAPLADVSALEPHAVVIEQPAVLFHGPSSRSESMFAAESSSSLTRACMLLFALAASLLLPWCVFVIAFYWQRCASWKKTLPPLFSVCWWPNLWLNVFAGFAQTSVVLAAGIHWWRFTHKAYIAVIVGLTVLSIIAGVLSSTIAALRWNLLLITALCYPIAFAGFVAGAFWGAHATKRRSVFALFLIPVILLFVLSFAIDILFVVRLFPETLMSVMSTSHPHVQAPFFKLKNGWLRLILRFLVSVYWWVACTAARICGRLIPTRRLGDTALARTPLLFAVAECMNSLWTRFLVLCLGSWDVVAVSIVIASAANLVAFELAFNRARLAKRLTSWLREDSAAERIGEFLQRWYPPLSGDVYFAHCVVIELVLCLVNTVCATLLYAGAVWIRSEHGSAFTETALWSLEVGSFMFGTDALLALYAVWRSSHFKVPVAAIIRDYFDLSSGHRCFTVTRFVALNLIVGFIIATFQSRLPSLVVLVASSSSLSSS